MNSGAVGVTIAGRGAGRGVAGMAMRVGGGLVETRVDLAEIDAGATGFPIGSADRAGIAGATGAGVAVTGGDCAGAAVSDSAEGADISGAGDAGATAGAGAGAAGVTTGSGGGGT